MRRFVAVLFLLSWAFTALAESVDEAIRQANAQLQKNLNQERERTRHAKFYYGWHEGYHYDPNNGWHRWNHQGLYDPFDPNITVRSRE